MTHEPKKIAALIVAAGQGTRAGGDLPKQWQVVAGRRIADWTRDRFQSHPAITQILFVITPDDKAHLPHDQRWVEGGATRAASVQAGLAALQDDAPDLVLIHDVARPCVSRDTIDAVIAALDAAPAAAPALPVTDALWVTQAGNVTAIQDRTGLMRAQTPQGFDFQSIITAHQTAPTSAADDIEVALAAGLTVAPVAGDEDNIKVTTAQDFARAARILESQMDIRLGNGYDVHRFGPGTSVTLCGVTLKHDRALQGHSDADVGMHALTDAIYGALADGDIGRHFPPSEAAWKDADSAQFLIHAMDRARARGFTLTNADVTLICEEPKIGPHAQAMQSRLADFMQVDAARISVKATTSEKLGFTGRREGIAAIATAALVGR